MKNLFDYIKNIIRLFFAWWTFPLAAWNGSRKLNKWVKKNKREQDNNLHPFSERHEYARKKMKGILRRAGIEVEVEGLDNLPKGGSWITPNHTSNLDGLYISKALGGKTDLVPVAKSEIKNSRLFKGYFIGVDSIFLDRDSIRQNLLVLDGAAQYAKQNGRGIVIFPEGTRSLSAELLDFKDGAFKFPQKYFLPIVPVTILGTLQAKQVFSLKTRKVKVIIHKPVKAIEHSKLPTEIVSRKISNIIANDLEKYEKSLSGKELNKFLKLRKKGKAQNLKKDKKIAKK